VTEPLPGPGGSPAIDLPDAGFLPVPDAGPEGSPRSPMLRTDRVAGILLVLLGAVVALEARTFRVAFLTDPLGPRALPLLVAGLLALCGLVLIRRPGPEPAWPRSAGLLRGAAGAGVFLLYSLLMQPLGFGASTAAAVAGLGLLFGGPPRRVLVVGLVTTALLWFLFVPLLGIPLPMGWLFTGGRG